MSVNTGDQTGPGAKFAGPFSEGGEGSGGVRAGRGRGERGGVCVMIEIEVEM